jgi:hypothetical protein
MVVVFADAKSGSRNYLANEHAGPISVHASRYLLARSPVVRGTFKAGVGTGMFDYASATLHQVNLASTPSPHRPQTRNWFSSTVACHRYSNLSASLRVT